MRSGFLGRGLDGPQCLLVQDFDFGKVELRLQKTIQILYSTAA